MPAGSTKNRRARSPSASSIERRNMGLRVAVTEKDGTTRRLSFDSHDITVGRTDDNDVCLPRGSVSKKHIRIAVEDGKVFVLDLKSTNGTFVNGRKLVVPEPVSASDRIGIGEFVLGVEEMRVSDPERAAQPPAPPPGTPPPDPARELDRPLRANHGKPG